LGASELNYLKPVAGEERSDEEGDGTCSALQEGVRGWVRETQRARETASAGKKNNAFL